MRLSSGEITSRSRRSARVGRLFGLCLSARAIPDEFVMCRLQFYQQHDGGPCAWYDFELFVRALLPW